MKLKVLLSALSAIALSVGTANAANTLLSPNERLCLSVDVNTDGQPTYSLTFDGNAVIKPSLLGLTCDHANLATGLAITDVATATHDETWEPVWGEYAQVRDHYNELAVTFTNPNRKSVAVTVRFRLFDDGLGFRYELPEKLPANYLRVLDESTEFILNDDYTLYCMPGDYNTDEFLYTTTPISMVGDALKGGRYHSESQAIEQLSVQTPLMAKSPDSKIYVNIHEAALVGYPAMSLDVDAPNYGLSAHLTPDKNGIAAYIELPFHTPWRTVIVADNACNILASQLIFNLNEPCKIEDTSWIKPQKFIGVWWEMFIGTQRTWAYSDYLRAKPGITDYTKLTPNGRHPANTENVKRYIDFAAESGIPSVLVEGWNEGWEEWTSYAKDRHFLFDKPYPDFDVDELQRYAAERGVKIIMHHETGANAADYERQLDRAFQYMVDHGYNSVKTGYVGTVIPRSEHHSSQWMVNHYLYVAQRAADYHIMIDSHEAVRPTGLCRTWPNWLAQESARGGEFEAFGGNTPEHTTILPFTRLKGGPMDYTPGLFEPRLSYYDEGRDSQAGTTLARQLALYLTMPSPLQMACDLPENYRRFPDAFQFIKDVPVDWSDSRYLEAEPGDYITVARKDKHSSDWYVGGITDENARTASIYFSFLPEGVEYEATVYADDKSAHWKDNPQAYKISTIGKVNHKTHLEQYIAPGGGFAIRLVPKK